MTNKQLAILLKQYHAQLNNIYDQLVDNMSELDVKRLIETKTKWIGEGDEPKGFDAIFRWGENWETIHEFTGDPIMLVDLKLFIDSLNDDCIELEMTDDE